MKEFFVKIPKLSNDEEVVARAGEGIPDPWAKEDQNPGIYGIRPLDEKGYLTPQYKKFLKEIHHVDAKRAGVDIKPSKIIEILNKKWRKIQEKKKESKRQAIRRITNFSSYDETEVQKLLESRNPKKRSKK